MDTTSNLTQVTSGRSRVRESRMPGSVRAKPNGLATRPSPSPMEARQAAAAVRLIQSTSAMIRAPIAYNLLFTRTNAAFQSSDERDVRAEMEMNNIPTLPVRLAKRAPYTRIFRDGVLLSELPELIEADLVGKSASVKEKALQQVTGAIDNARDYAQAVIQVLVKEVP